MGYTYTALLEDSGGQTSFMQFSQASSPAKIETFAAAHCSAGLIGVNKLTDAELTVTAAEADSDVQRKAFIYAKGENDESIRFSIPAPDPATVLTEQTEVGERVTQAAGEDICADWSIIAGNTTTFIEGIVVERE